MKYKIILFLLVVIVCSAVSFFIGGKLVERSYERYIEAAYGLPENFVSNPAQLVLKDMRMKEADYLMAVVGVIENKSHMQFSYVTISANFFLEDHYINSCGSVIEHLSAGEEQDVFIKCNDLEYSLKDLGIRFEISYSGIVHTGAKP